MPSQIELEESNQKREELVTRLKYLEVLMSEYKNYLQKNKVTSSEVLKMLQVTSSEILKVLQVIRGKKMRECF